MSKHTKGLLVADWNGFDASYDLDTEDRNTIADGLRKEDARRLAACWNMFLDIDTDVIEIMPTFIEFQQANKQTLHETLCELNAARALLREALDTIEEFPDEDHEIADRIKDYLDACDKPGEPDAS